MKIRHIITILIGLLLGTAGVYAQTITRDIAGGTLAPFTVSDGQTVLLRITGDIALNQDAPIQVNNGGTLHIVNATNPPRPITITNNVDKELRGDMFRVHCGGSLYINQSYPGEDGTKRGTIIIDAGADFTGQATAGGLIPQKSRRAFNRSMVQNAAGTLVMDNVTIRNFWSPEFRDLNNPSKDNRMNDVGVIGICPTRSHIVEPSSPYYKAGSNYPCGPTIIKNTTVERCKSNLGTFITVGYGYVDDTHNYLDISDANAESGRIDIVNCTITDCEICCDVNGWGGAIRCKGGSINKLFLTNTSFTHNYSHGDGPTLWWNAAGTKSTKCEIDGCSFTDNIAERDAGGLRLEGTFEFKGSTTNILRNRCKGRNNTDKFNGVNRVLGNGGGIQVYGYAGTANIVGGELTYKLPKCLYVSDNTAASYGGGIAFEFNTDKLIAGTKIYADFDGVIIKDNKADVFGGGVYMRNSTPIEKNYTFKVELNSGTIEDNESPNGGGMYIRDLTVGSKDGGVNTLYIQNNTALKTNTENTGNGGGIYLHSGSLDLQRTNILGNTALNGGGLFVYHGSFTSSEGSVVSGNTSTEYGGGVFVYNNTANTSGTNMRDFITLTAGTISNNTGKWGGGLAAYGNLELTMLNTSIESNTALNGGGLFAYGLQPGSGAVVHYKSGLVRYNKATSTEKITTAYDMSYETISGVGGGIYMGRYTHLDFRDPQTQITTKEVGIYSNKAENAADDIFGYNQNVYLLLPNVSNLELSGFNEESVKNLYWVEDYVSNDTNYASGLKLKGTAWDSDQTNQRYRDVIEEKVQGNYYAVEFGTKIENEYSGRYLCLAIGWHINRITLVKDGMKDGENAIFTIYKDGVEYMTLMLTDADKQGDGKRYKEIELKSDGIYRIVETPWSWAYNVNGPNEITRDINITTSDQDRIFTFSNTAKEDAPIHKEDVEINKIRIGN